MQNFLYTGFAFALLPPLIIAIGLALIYIKHNEVVTRRQQEPGSEKKQVHIVACLIVGTVLAAFLIPYLATWLLSLIHGF